MCGPGLEDGGREVGGGAVRIEEMRAVADCRWSQARIVGRRGRRNQCERVRAGSSTAHAVVLSRDGERLVTFFSNGWIVMREVASDKLLWKQRVDNLELATFFGGTGRLANAIACCDDRRVVASTHLDGTVRVWDGMRAALFFPVWARPGIM